MATKQSTVDFILDQVSALPSVRTYKMFGDYALYCNEKVVGLICDDELFIKVTEPGKTFVGDTYQEGIPYKGAKPYMLITDQLDDPEWLCQLLTITAHVLPLPKPKKKFKK